MAMVNGFYENSAGPTFSFFFKSKTVFFLTLPAQLSDFICSVRFTTTLRVKKQQKVLSLTSLAVWYQKLDDGASVRGEEGCPCPRGW